MTLVTRGTLAAALALVLLGCLLAAPGCSATEKGPLFPPMTTPGPATPPPLPQTSPPLTPRSAATTPTPVDLSSPPKTLVRTPYPVPPIVGTWYAPPPDDLTFEFRPDGYFVERSPNFRTYVGTWRISEEGEGDFYDADILDRWGYKKPAHLLYASGTLLTKGIGTMHRVS
ncbi:MAG TPA: hypothetical protein VKO45_06780 [Methanomicrobiales archaeon]|nr:hypothetical protein [Methanomicrobiales archaeon]